MFMREGELLAYSWDEWSNHCMMAGLGEQSSTALFTTFVSEQAEEAVDIVDLYKDSSTEPFTLYTIDATNSLKDNTNFGNLLWYRYGARYNRNNEKDPISPKVFYLDMPETKDIFELVFYGKNIILQVAPTKEIGRDSYYVTRDAKKVTSHAWQDIISSLITSDHTLYLGTNKQIDMVDVLWLSQWFTDITWFDAVYVYRPYRMLTLEELLHNPGSIAQERREFDNSLDNAKDLQIIQSVWERGGNVLPLTSNR